MKKSVPLTDPGTAKISLLDPGIKEDECREKGNWLPPLGKIYLRLDKLNSFSCNEQINKGNLATRFSP